MYPCRDASDSRHCVRTYWQCPRCLGSLLGISHRQWSHHRGGRQRRGMEAFLLGNRTARLGGRSALCHLGRSYLASNAVGPRHGANAAHPRRPIGAIASARMMCPTGVSTTIGRCSHIHKSSTAARASRSPVKPAALSRPWPTQYACPRHPSNTAFLLRGSVSTRTKCCRQFWGRLGERSIRRKPGA